jgi:hypothetical protein
MSAELDKINPEMDHEQLELTAKPVAGDEEHATTPDADHDREGAMAKADLYKLASYSQKLFKQLNDEDQLEAWVQAKITKAADYIASVYHYLEYEMKFSEYGQALDNSDVLSEDVKAQLKTKLVEAKSKLAELKKKQAAKMKGKVEETFDADTKTGSSYKTSKGGTVTKTDTGIKHEKGDYDDEDYVAPPKSHAKSRSAAEKKSDKDLDKAEAKKSKEIEKKFPGKLSRYIDGKKVNEEGDDVCPHCGGTGHSTHEEPETTVSDKAKNLAKKYNTATRAHYAAHKRLEQESQGETCNECGMMMEKCTCDHTMKESDTCNECGMMMEKCTCDHTMKEGKPSAGLSKAKKSAVVKKAKAGGDIGKPGKNFKKVAAKAAEKYGSKEKGEKVAAAAMWKNIKETTAYLEEKKKLADKDYDGDGKIETGAEEHAGAVDKAIKASKAKGKETVKESVEVNRIKALTQRLLG